ncbi:MAG TPA: beta-ketoacyl synthase chain length factor [Puia sp.]|nr:beta-ketoacyl synthase chain length factor [Puia sp.]
MKIYIRATASISPAPGAATTGNRLKAVEPGYSAYIDPKSIRRMSRIVKMGVAAAFQCLKEAEVPVPDAIITGTAYGCLGDTDIFLSRLIQQQEEALSPTAFIQSTHNTVGAQIALMLQCTGYNNTFVHRGFSFESALLDAMMLLQEGAAKTVLTGGLDEITDASHAILERFGLYRQGAMGAGVTAAAVDGEGATFFLLSSEPSGKDHAILEGLDTFYKPATAAEIENKIDRFLSTHSLKRKDIDLVLTGADYKHLCGEYPTASAYALAMAAGALNVAVTGNHKRILIHNDYLNIHHSLMLVTKC